MPLRRHPSQMGARISSNDFSPFDSTPFRYAVTTSRIYAEGSLPFFRARSASWRSWSGVSVMLIGIMRLGSDESCTAFILERVCRAGPCCPAFFLDDGIRDVSGHHCDPE